MSELVVSYDREHLTVWGNSSSQIVRKCYREVRLATPTRRAAPPPPLTSALPPQNPSIPLLFSLPRVLQLLGLFYTGLLPFVPLKEQFLEIPMPSIVSKY